MFSWQCWARRARRDEGIRDTQTARETKSTPLNKKVSMLSYGGRQSRAGQASHPFSPEFASHSRETAARVPASLTSGKPLEADSTGPCEDDVVADASSMTTEAARVDRRGFVLCVFPALWRAALEVLGRVFECFTIPPPVTVDWKKKTLEQESADQVPLVREKHK